VNGTLPSAAASRSRWADPLGRAGFVGKGALYAILAVIAIKVAAGEGGRTEDQRGALSALADEPFGLFLLVLLALGLAAYALWRLVEVVLGVRGEAGASDYGERAASLVRAIAYGTLSVFAWIVVAGDRTSGTSESKETATVLDWPGGVALVTAVGIVVLGVAAYQAYAAATQAFLKKLRLGEASEGERRAATWIGTAGHAARAVVFGLIGVFLVKAALEYDPKEAVGIDGALREVAAQPYGRYLLGLVAAGLLLFGVYCLIEARFRRV
jgi:hypothetical protein